MTRALTSCCHRSLQLGHPLDVCILKTHGCLNKDWIRCQTWRHSRMVGVRNNKHSRLRPARGTCGRQDCIRIIVHATASIERSHIGKPRPGPPESARTLSRVQAWRVDKTTLVNRRAESGARCRDEALRAQSSSPPSSPSASSSTDIASSSSDWRSRLAMSAPAAPSQLIVTK